MKPKKRRERRLRSFQKRPHFSILGWISLLVTAAAAVSLFLGFHAINLTTHETRLDKIRKPWDVVRVRRVEEYEYSVDVTERKTAENLNFDYNIPALPTADTLPDPTLQVTNGSLVILVLSARAHALRRKAIRETWGQNRTLLFAIGGRKNESNEVEIQQNLHQEQSEYHDLLDTIHPDSYVSLPHKLKFAYHWIVRNDDTFQWILKVDDDMFVRANLMQNGLLKLFNSTVPTVIGRILRHYPVQRNGKWAETKYQNPIYPPWPQGSCGYVASRGVAEYIAEAYEKDSMKQKHEARMALRIYQGEDTSLGIWLEQSGQDILWANSPFFVNHGNCMLNKKSQVSAKNATSPPNDFFLSIGHKITPEQMRRCFESGVEQTLPSDSVYHLDTHPKRISPNTWARLDETSDLSETSSAYLSAIAHHRLDETTENRNAETKRQRKRREQKRKEQQQQRQKAIG